MPTDHTVNVQSVNDEPPVVQSIQNDNIDVTLREKIDQQEKSVISTNLYWWQ